ncbi:hypothetical protein ABZ883_39505 [Streptomyces sp. NPDC046977]|uniref:hypothetical protein n=1 Tax=Streptomyces sp. NPDC046977 TaxID=3154703 RepID=UPI00340FEF8E
MIAWNTDKLDWVALGESLNVFSGNSANLSFAERLQKSPAIRDYLLKHIAVAQAGRACHGAVIGGLEDFLARGAQVAFDCPAPVVDVDVTISSLTDLHPAYRTMLTSAGPAEPQQALFTSARPTTHVRFTASGGSVQKTVAVFSVGTLLAALAIGGFALWRSRRRKAARFGSGSPSVQQSPAAHDAALADTGAGSRSNA